MLLIIFTKSSLVFFAQWISGCFLPNFVPRSNDSQLKKITVSTLWRTHGL